MGIWEILVGAFVLIFSVIMIIVIILQEGHDSGLGTITGGADSFLKRGKAKTADALFAKITKYCAIAFFFLVVLLNALSYFGLTGKSGDSKTETSTSETSVVSEVSTEESTTAGEETSEQTSTETTESAAESSTEAAESSTEESAESSAEAAESSAKTAESSAETAESSSTEE